ncbi:hypothetical protein V8F20_006370 [Naviculisporaceae sp. PSN 640]
MAPAPLSFLHLARELRDMIYEHYLTIDGGYVFNPATWKLKPSKNNSSPHPFALQYTCKLIASEMRGIALTFNLITFTPVETLGVRAWGFEWLENMYEVACAIGLRKLSGEYSEKELPSSVKESLSRQKPEYFQDDDLDQIFSSRSRHLRQILWFRIGAPMSDFLGFTRVLLTQPEFAEFWTRLAGPDFLGLNLFCQPWMIPSQEELGHFWQVLGPMMDHIYNDVVAPPDSPLLATYFDQLFNNQSGTFDPRNRFKHRFSATAAAISFLHSLDPSTRLYIRRLIVDERTESVAHPERHGRGLVQFCNENPRLLVERRVSLWRTILPQTERGTLYSVYDVELDRGRVDMWDRVRHGAGPDLWSSTFWGQCYTEHEAWSKAPNAGEIFPGRMSQAISRWVLEALSLPKTFTLVIDGAILPQLSSQLFREIVVPDAVWQAAFEESFSSGRLEKPPYWAWRTPNDWRLWDENWQPDLEPTYGYICEDFPNIVRGILDGSSRVSLNFEIGDDSFDRQVKNMLAERKDWREEDWYRSWERRHAGKSINPAPPLARDWYELFELDMVPREERMIQTSSGGPESPANSQA